MCKCRFFRKLIPPLLVTDYRRPAWEMSILHCKSLIFWLISLLRKNKTLFLSYVYIFQSNTGYPLMKFRVTTKEVFRRSGIVCEVSEDNLLKLKKRGVLVLPSDYWSFLPKDSNIDESCLKPTRRILTHAQVKEWNLSSKDLVFYFLVLVFWCCL